ncbi:extracellular solute-binding protein [Lactobacillus sp.]|uniref:extracellular solute-binding protein n=1 Tax=Lactobacillus sp. TaxID=1591 RepID=UPI001990D288|nr:extracellular solute-binding protein [Lactobacillus sp.]MBD5430696.1 extracellular solute-binding protein [Lactobacillus sp.]
MKFTKKLAAISIAALALLGTTACSNKSSSNNSSSSAKVATKITKKTTVVFWHGMSGTQEKTLKSLTKEFEKKNPKITIKLENQGNYTNLQAKINSTLQSPNNLPTITQAYPGWLINAANSKRLVDMTPYINNTKIGWGSAAKSDIRKELLNGAKINNTQYGIPFNKSVEMLTYNKDLLDKYGVKVPKTMDELKKAAQTIYKKSKGKVVGAGFDSLSNYYVLGMKDEGENFTKNLNFTSSKSKKVINYYADGVKAGYFKTAGSDGYLSTDFSNQKIAMFVGTSAGESFVKLGVGNKFQYGVAPRPSKYNMQQGTDIYMFNKGTAEQKTAAFMYIKFLLSKKQQLTWANQTGYIPVTNSVINSSAYKNSTKSKVPAQLSKAMKNLYSVPVVTNSNAAYTELNPIMQNILAQAKKGKSWNSQIEAGKTKLQSTWNQ